MASAKITLFGMYEYGETTGEYELFSGLTVPSEIPDSSDVNDLLQFNILERGGEFEVLYAEPSFMIAAIAKWSAKWHDTILRWYKALNIEYNPLENYDRIEEWMDQSTGTEGKTRTESRSNESDQRSTSFGADASVQDTSVDVENKVSDYDQSTYQPSEKNETTGKAENNSSRMTDSLSKQNDNEVNHGQETNIDSRSSGHTGRIHGNIGVTTSQQMLQAELDVARFNFIDEVTDLFMRELLIYTY